MDSMELIEKVSELFMRNELYPACPYPLNTVIDNGGTDVCVYYVWYKDDAFCMTAASSH